jgi:XRE family transcriptional regulator, regulator of sulfur utilization
VLPNLKYRRILGEAIRFRRKQSKLSQEKLAEKAELHPVYISAVERGAKNISVDALIRIAKALGVRVRDLVENI